MPEEDGKVELTTSNCKMPVPSVCHVDFECFTEKIETCESNLFLFLFFNFLIFFVFVFLQHDTYINYIKVPFMGLSTYIALHYLLTAPFRYN